MMLRNRRRDFLRGVGGASFAASTLRFFTRNAEAATHPLRFVFVYFSSGRYQTSVSTGTGTGYKLGVDMSPFESIKKKLLIVDGLRIPDHTGEEHPCGKCALLTGRMANENGRVWKARGISFDRYLAGKIAGGTSFYGGSSGVGLDDVFISWHAAGSSNETYTQGADATFKKLFPAGAPAPAPTTPTGEPTLRDRQNVLLYDHLMGEVNRLRRFAPKSEVEKLELHVQALTQIRAGFDKTSGGEMPGATLRQCSPNIDFPAGASAADRFSLTIAHALACGRTRIAVVHICDDEPYHDYSHNPNDPGPTAALRKIDVERAAAHANLLKYLDSFQEGTGTLLDNTVVMFGSECSGMYSGDDSDGNGVHATTNMPIFLAGGANAKIKNGERLVTTGKTSLDVLRAIARQLGVDASDFGDSAWANPSGIPEITV